MNIKDVIKNLQYSAPSISLRGWNVETTQLADTQKTAIQPGSGDDRAADTWHKIGRAVQQECRDQGFCIMVLL